MQEAEDAARMQMAHPQQQAPARGPPEGGEDEEELNQMADHDRSPGGADDGQRQEPVGQAES